MNDNFCIKCGRSRHHVPPILPRMRSYLCAICLCDAEFLDVTRCGPKTPDTYRSVEMAALRVAILSDDAFSFEVWLELSHES